MFLCYTSTIIIKNLLIYIYINRKCVKSTMEQISKPNLNCIAFQVILFRPFWGSNGSSWSAASNHQIYFKKNFRITSMSRLFLSNRIIRFFQQLLIRKRFLTFWKKSCQTKNGVQKNTINKQLTNSLCWTKKTSQTTNQQINFGDFDLYTT